MAAFRGERFHVQLDSDDEDDAQADPTPPSTALDPKAGLVRDVQERASTSSTAPSAPRIKPGLNGFPAHTKRTNASRFKRGLASPQEEVSSTASASQANTLQSEKESIGRENDRRIAQMSPDTIEHERQQLLEALTPSLVERLLKRANIDGPLASSLSNESPYSMSQPRLSDESDKGASREATAVDSQPRTSTTTQPDPEDDEPAPASSLLDMKMPPSIHFPQPAELPDLDPSSPSFLTDLHRKYFPSLPADPSKLAWMSHPSSRDRDNSAYSPDRASYSVSALRFSFRGQLLPPRTSRDIPVTKGLHHHGDAPDSAGYTIPELAHLSRSSFPAQRCVAYQTLGRLLYRLGRGDFGEFRSDPVQGMYNCLEEGRVWDTMQEESAREGGHMSAKAYATEALWLWHKGGGVRLAAE